MSESLKATCPYCDTSFQVAAEQLAQADGRVRCGNCLQTFDAVRGEMDFVAPQIKAEDVPHPIAGINVKPMAAADLPSAGAARPWASYTVLMALLAGLAAQIFLPGLIERAKPPAVELTRLVIRPHPESSGALRLDAVLRNPADAAVAYPLLVLGFTNRQGEPRARRTFLPSEYLHGNQTLRMPPNSEIQVSLSLADPGRDAVNYVARLETGATATN